MPFLERTFFLAPSFLNHVKMECKPLTCHFQSACLGSTVSKSSRLRSKFLPDRKELFMSCPDLAHLAGYMADVETRS